MAAQAALLALSLLLTACSRSTPPDPGRPVSASAFDPKTGVSASRRILADGDRIPKGGGHYKVGAPYRIAGRWYYPREEPGYDRRGIASWYGDDFHGRKTANGEIYDMYALTAAHPTLPLPSYVWVTNESNGRTLLVRVNDRGPYAHDRIIDLSRAVARALGSEGRGLAEVRVRYAGPAPLDGNDAREQAVLRNQPWYRPGDLNVASSRQTAPQRPPAALGAAPSRLPPGQMQQVRTAAPFPSHVTRHYVAAGSFRSEANAARRAAEIRRFAPAEVRAVSSGTGPVFRVRSAAMSDAAAHRLRQQLADAGIRDAAVLTE